MQSSFKLLLPYHKQSEKGFIYLIAYSAIRSMEKQCKPWREKERALGEEGKAVLFLFLGSKQQALNRHLQNRFKCMSDKIDGKWKTWNPVIGCLHNCTYCWARRFALERLGHTEKYKDGFAPKLAENELSKRFRKQFVFVSDMGDLFGDWVPKEWILKVIDTTRRSPSSDFLFLTKNPKRFKEFVHLCRDNIILGATIESNRLYNFSRAPPVTERARAMTELSFKRKLISIEPILDFDLDIFANMIESIAPFHVSVGYDNWQNRLPEPSLSKTLQLIERLNKSTNVRERKLREACSR